MKTFQGQNEEKGLKLKLFMLKVEAFEGENLMFAVINLLSSCCLYLHEWSNNNKRWHLGPPVQ